MISMGLIRCTVIAALALGFAGGAHADDFPSRPITMIITFAAGGITDVVARIYADVASRNIGQRIIVDNRPTGGGAVAALAVQNAPPDGYTLLVFAGAQHAALPARQPVAYQPVSGFQPWSISKGVGGLSRPTLLGRCAKLSRPLASGSSMLPYPVARPAP